VPLSLEEDPPAIVQRLRDGLLLCALVNVVAPSSIDLRALNLDSAKEGALVPWTMRAGKGGAPPYFPCRENIEMALSAAESSAGARLPKHVTATAIEAGIAPAISDFLWALLKLHVTASLRAQQADAASAVVARLALDGETADDVARLSPEKLILRWVNFQLARAPGGCGLAGRVDSFGAALADGVALCALLRVVSPELSSDIPQTDSAVRAAGPTESVTQALSTAYGAGVSQWFTVEAITEGNARLQLAFLALLFSVAPGLQAPAAPPSPATVPATLEASSVAGLQLPSPSATRTLCPKLARLAVGPVPASAPMPTASSAPQPTPEETYALTRDAMTVAQWFNSLDIEGVCLRRAAGGLGVLRELADGVTLLRVLDAIEPGIVQWSRATIGPKTRAKMVENCNYVVNLGRAMEFGLSDVAGVDLVDSNAALVVPFLWQLMRYSTLRRLSESPEGSAFSGFAPDEAQVLAWANERVAAASSKASGGQEVRVRSFGDSELATGIYFLYLVGSLRRGCVDWKIVSDGETREQQFENAIYLLSVARKLGCRTSCTWDDIVDVHPRNLVLFVTSLIEADDLRRASDSASR
jgi:plastin-1